MKTSDRKLRLPEPLRAIIDASAAANDQSMNAEMVEMLWEAHDNRELAAERERLATDALTLAYGPDNTALLVITGEILRAIDPRGTWRDDAEKANEISRAHIHLMKRLRVGTADPTIILDDSVEGKVDKLLWDLGNDGSEYHDEPGYVARWATDIRSRLGNYGPLLVEMRRAVRKTSTRRMRCRPNN